MDNNVLVFCTAYSDSLTGWDARVGKWLQGVRQSGLIYNYILIVDDGSPVLPKWDDVKVIQEGGDADLSAGAGLFHFTNRVGRISRGNFPGWWRSYSFAAHFARKHNFTKVVHIESDAFLISDAIVQKFNSIEEGWVSPWCARHNFPEIAIQVIAGNSLDAFFRFADTPYERLADQIHEWSIPLTNILRDFAGDRHGEYQSFVPPDADWTTQTITAAPWPDYLWWLDRSRVLNAPTSSKTVVLTGKRDLDAIGRRHGTDKSSTRHDFLRFYERFFRDLRSKPVHLLEIGVNDGASLRTWNEYFECGLIIGLDQKPETRKHSAARIRVELADQSNLAELMRVAHHYGPFDIIVDDGSHIWDHQIISFQWLYSLVKPGGFYIMEDIDTSFGRYANDYKGIRETSPAEYLQKFSGYLVGDSAIDNSGELDPFLRSFPRKTEFTAFYRRTCLIRKK